MGIHAVLPLHCVGFCTGSVCVMVILGKWTCRTYRYAYPLIGHLLAAYAAAGDGCWFTGLYALMPHTRCVSLGGYAAYNSNNWVVNMVNRSAWCWSCGHPLASLIPGTRRQNEEVVFCFARDTSGYGARIMSEATHWHCDPVKVCVS